MRSTRKTKKTCDMCHIAISDRYELPQCIDCGRIFASKRALKNELIKRFGEESWEKECDKLIRLRERVIKRGFWGMGQNFSMYGPPLDPKDKESFEIFYEFFDEEEGEM